MICPFFRGSHQLAYVGSIAPYQNLEQGTLAFVRHAMTDPHVRFLAITSDAPRFRMLVAEAGVPVDRCTILSLPQDAVPSMLCAADVGLLLRAPSRVNEVSMPVKLGEYLSSGVPVLVSRIAGWVSEIVDDAKAGVAVSWFGTSERARQQEMAHAIHELRRNAEGYRQRALALCEKRFVWSAYTTQVRHAYVASLRAASETDNQRPSGHDTPLAAGAT